jgi:S-adenosylmethionine decarboxylase
MLRHWVCGFFGCSPKKLNNLAGLTNFVTRASGKGSLCVMDHQVTHRFSPEGITVIATEARSHIIVHTWPSKGYAAIDIAFSAPHANPQDALDFLAKRLDPTETTVLKLDRSWEDGSCGSTACS